MFEEKFGKILKKSVSLNKNILSIGVNDIYLDYISTVYIIEPTQRSTGYFFFSPSGKPPTSATVIKTSGFTFSFKELHKAEKLINIFYDMEGIEVNYDGGSSFQKLKSESVVKQQEFRRDQNRIRCPECTSTDFQHLGNKRKGFSVGKAAGGAILTGGIGTLAGFAGKDGKKERWLCNKCGIKFTQ